MESKLPKERLREFLPAIEKLLIFYRGMPLEKSGYSYYNRTGKGCPLCVQSRNIVLVEGGYICDFCLWTFFETNVCGKYYTKTMKERIERLERWEQSILQEGGYEK